MKAGIDSVWLFAVLPLLPIEGPPDGLEKGAGREEDLVLAVVRVLRRCGAHVAGGVGDDPFS